jgi:hypothetical protein
MRFPICYVRYEQINAQRSKLGSNFRLTKIFHKFNHNSNRDS